MLLSNPPSVQSFLYWCCRLQMSMGLPHDHTIIWTGQLQLNVWKQLRCTSNTNKSPQIFFNCTVNIANNLSTTVRKSNWTAKYNNNFSISVPLASVLSWNWMNWRNELYLSRRDLVQQGQGSLVPFIIFQCWIIISTKLWIVKLLLVNCYNNDSSWTKQLICI